MRQVSAAKFQDASGLPTETTLYRGDIKSYFRKKKTRENQKFFLKVLRI